MIRYLEGAGRVLAAASVASLAATAALSAQERVIAIRGGTVLPISGAPIPNGTVLIRGSKIVAVGANVAIPAGAEIVDARSKYVMPGVVDAMSNIGIGDSDLNEASDPMTPGARVIESYNPFGPFGQGKLGGRQAGIAAITPGIALVVAGEERGRLGVAPAPDEDLFVPILGGGLGLVQALQGAVVPLVQPPVAHDRQPHQIEVVEDDPQGADGAFEERRVGDVEGQAAGGIDRVFDGHEG